MSCVSTMKELTITTEFDKNVYAGSLFDHLNPVAKGSCYTSISVIQNERVWQTDYI